MDSRLKLKKMGEFRIKVHRKYPAFIQNYKETKESTILNSTNARKKTLVSKFFTRLLERNFFQHDWKSVTRILSVLIYLSEYNNQLIWKVGIELIRHVSMNHYQKEMFFEIICSICTPYKHQITLIQLLERIVNIKQTSNKHSISSLKNHYSSIVTALSKTKSYLNTKNHTNFLLGSIEHTILNSNMNTSIDDIKEQQLCKTNSNKKNIEKSTNKLTIIKRRCLEHLGSIVESTYWPATIDKLVDVVEIADKIKYFSLYIDKHPYDSITIEKFVKYLQSIPNDQYDKDLMESSLHKLSLINVQSEYIMYLIDIYVSTNRYFEAIDVLMRRLSIYGHQHDSIDLEMLSNILSRADYDSDPQQLSLISNLWLYEQELWQFYDQKSVKVKTKTKTNMYSIGKYRAEIFELFNKIYTRCSFF